MLYFQFFYLFFCIWAYYIYMQKNFNTMGDGIYIEKIDFYNK